MSRRGIPSCGSEAGSQSRLSFGGGSGIPCPGQTSSRRSIGRTPSGIPASRIQPPTAGPAHRIPASRIQPPTAIPAQRIPVININPPTGETTLRIPGPIRRPARSAQKMSAMHLQPPTATSRRNLSTSQAEITTPRTVIPTPRAQIPTPRAQIPTPRAQIPTPRAQIPTPSTSAQGSLLRPPSQHRPPPGGAVSRGVPPARPVAVQKPPPAGLPKPVYQKRSVSGASSGYGIPPGAGGLAPRPSISSESAKVSKIITKTVDVDLTSRGTQQVTRELTYVSPAPPDAPVGTFPLPVISPRETTFIQTQTLREPGRPPGVVPKSPLGNISPASRLSQEVEHHLDQAARICPTSQKTLKVTGAKTTMVPPPVVMLNNAPTKPVKQVISERTVETSPGIEKISRTLTGIEQLSPCTARKTELQVQELHQSPGPHPSSPPREAISVRNVINVMPTGQRGTDKIVTYEKTTPNEDYDLSPAEVSRMVTEENQDIRKSEKWKTIELVTSSPGSAYLKKKQHELMLTGTAMKSRHESVVLPDQAPDEAPNDEIAPELMASIMHTEEKGLDMLSEPTQIYTLLFPDGSELGPDVIEINSAAPAPLNDVAVPSHALPETFYNNSVNAELEKVIMETEGQGRKPSAAGYSDYQEKKRPGACPGEQTSAIVENIRKKHAKKPEPSIQPVKPLEEEEPPWTPDEGRDERRRQKQREDEEKQQEEQLKQIEKTLADLVGASPAKQTETETLADSFSMGLSHAEAVDYMLHVEPPVYRSQFQLRGSCVPSWFPGYYVAFPEVPELVTTVKYPMIAISAAWKNTKPNTFPEDSFVVI